MRQVPFYLIIGNGQVARHFRHYFDLIALPYAHWHRHSLQSLNELSQAATHVLILITDSQIDSFIEQNSALKQKILIHFSGSHISAYAEGVHPLQTFNPKFYALEQYQAIPFILEAEGKNSFKDLFPTLINPHYRLSQKFKPFYHSLCVMANNFSTILWQKLFTEFTKTFGLPQSCALPILEQTFINLKHDFKKALTGPLVRDDSKTIKENLNALNSDPYQIVYQAFVSIKQREKK